MNVYEAPTNEAIDMQQTESRACGFNCNGGFGVGIVIAMIGPLPGPT